MDADELAAAVAGLEEWCRGWHVNAWSVPATSIEVAEDIERVLAALAEAAETATLIERLTAGGRRGRLTSAPTRTGWTAMRDDDRAEGPAIVAALQALAVKLGSAS